MDALQTGTINVGQSLFALTRNTTIDHEISMINSSLFMMYHSITLCILRFEEYIHNRIIVSFTTDSLHQYLTTQLLQ